MATATKRIGTLPTILSVLLVGYAILGPGRVDGRPVEGGRPTGVHSAQANEYVGSRACRRCHLREYRSWEGTRHAKAFERLSPGAASESKRKVNLNPEQDFRDNEFCLRCHTVGYRQPGGFVSVEETPELQGVGCENCHGPGGGYIADDVMGRNNPDHSFDEVRAAGLVWPVPEETCRTCHGGDTPFNAALFPEFAIEYTRETLAGATHEHRPLRREHGPLPPGVLFQETDG